MTSGDRRDPATGVARTVLEHYHRQRDALATVNSAAADAFARRDWRIAHGAVAARLDAYADGVAGAVAAVAGLGAPGYDREVWVAAKARFADAFTGAAGSAPDRDIAETFFNSCTRRVLGTVGVDPEVEFTETPPVAGVPDLVRVPGPDVERMLHDVVSAPELGGRWHNLTRDALLGADEVRRALRLHGATAEVDEAVMVAAPFFRGQGAYLVGRLIAGPITMPLALAIHHTTRGLVIGAVLTEPGEVGVLFSYTRAAFCVDTPCPAALVTFLGDVVPTRTRAELYTAVGYPKHGKTELYRDLSRHIAAGTDRFDHARGIQGHGDDRVRRPRLRRGAQGDPGPSSPIPSRRRDNG